MNENFATTLQVNAPIGNAAANGERYADDGRLSLRLRDETRASHEAVECAIGLPAAIQSLADYKKYLLDLYLFYSPLEDQLASFRQWNEAGINVEDYRQSGRLMNDLKVFGITALGHHHASRLALPELPGFPQALGALYVLEGSTLGSLYILRQLMIVLGDQIIGSCRFLCGRGSATGEHWKIFQGLLDAYGHNHPADIGAVVDGAKATFQAIGNWVQSANGG